MRNKLGMGLTACCILVAYVVIGCSMEDDPLPVATDNRAPMLANHLIVPPSTRPGTQAVLFSVEVTDLNGQGDIAQVKAEAVMPEHGAYLLHDDGGVVDLDPAPGFQGSGDLIAGDKVFTALGSAPVTTGAFVFAFSARDRSGLTAPPLSRTLVVDDLPTP